MPQGPRGTSVCLRTYVIVFQSLGLRTAFPITALGRLEELEGGLEVEASLPEVETTEEQRQEMEQLRCLKYSSGKKAPDETEQQRREKYSHGKKEP